MSDWYENTQKWVKQVRTIGTMNDVTMRGALGHVRGPGPDADDPQDWTGEEEPAHVEPFKGRKGE